MTKNLDSIVTSWNPAAIAIFGYKPEEMIGQSILRLIPVRLHHEENEVIRRLQAGEQIAHFETTRVTKSGVEIAVSLTISPIRDASGKVIGASKIARNITQRNQLDRARLQLAAIVESSEDAIISKNLDGIIQSWNSAAEKLFGYTESEIVGSSILRLIPEDLQKEEPLIISKLLNGERIEHFETVRLKKNGERIEVSLTISPIKNAAGKVVGASKILRDISSQRRLQASLLQAEKFAATGRMAASIAHEINNPLEGLLNLIYLAKLSADDPNEVRSLLQTAEGELDRVSHIARQTLGYYRENASPIPIQLLDLVEDVLRIYTPGLRSAGIELHTHFEPVPPVQIKRGEIMQVLSNLIANSIHAMPEGGNLTLSLCQEAIAGEPCAVIAVRDTGAGIDAENLTRIFEPFFTTRGSIGTGIGLWVAQQFVESHKGQLRVETSTDPISHGTVMSIHLPVCLATTSLQTPQTLF